MPQKELVNTESEYAYGNKVEVISGFYKGRTGTINSIVKDGYRLLMVINGESVFLTCKTEQIRKSKNFFGK